MQPCTTATLLLLITASAWGQFGFGFGRKRNNYGSMDRYRDSYRDRDNYGSASTGRGYSNSASSYNGLSSGAATDRDGSSGGSYSSGSSGSSYGGGSNYGGGSSYGGGNGGGGYGGGGGGYGGGGHGGGYGGHEKGLNPLAALIAPLAGLALLGAAAAVATNPVLLTLAVLSSGRKKRDTEDAERHMSVFGLQNLESDKLDLETNRRIKELQTLEKYIATVPGAEKPNEKLMANYLSCSGFTEPENQCIDRIVCEYSDQNGDATTELEKDVISIVLYNIMGNNFVSNDFKDRLREAARVGKSQGQCKRYRCSELKDQQF